MAGRFIVLEGGDASGKSTQARRLAWRLGAEGHDVVETFEPGDTPAGAQIRSLLLDPAEQIEPMAEMLLMAADRAQQVAEVIRPALHRGAVVVADRYVPSSLVYQGVARDLGVDVVDHVNRVATGALDPELVVVLDVDEHTVSTRRSGPGDRMEQAGPEFHATVRRAYRDLAPRHGWTVVDGGGTEDEVAERVWQVVSR